jgi:2-polyprenyl-3-methyl-5-hydroxy-6-metoxy-1,4-benzoquinol methylase
MEWFEEWFDSKYYHILYKNRDETEAQRVIENLVQHFNIKPDQKILDLACGKGRHSVYLNQLGFDVVGLDLSEKSIIYAKQFENERLKFNIHDMRLVYKKNSFDVVLNLFTSFGYFENIEENKKVLESIHKQLKKGGKLIVDFMNSKKVINQLIPSETKTIEEINFTITKEYTNSIIKKEIQFEADKKQHCFQEKVQALSIDDFIKISDKLFSIVAIFGNYELGKFDETTSDRLIIEFQKIDN